MLAVTLQGLATTTGGWRCSRPTGGAAADQEVRPTKHPFNWRMFGVGHKIRYHSLLH